MTDGRVTLMDRSEGLMRVFAEDGREIAKVGRRGQGPGEFGSFATATSWGGDTIGVYDPQTARVSLHSHGEFVGILSLKDIPGLAASGLLGRLDGGTMLFARSITLGDGRTTPMRSRFSLLGWSPGLPTAHLFRDSILGSQFHAITSGGRSGVALVNFARSTFIAPMRDQIALYDNSAPRIEIMDASGRTTRIIVLEIEDPRVSQTDRDSVVERVSAARGPVTPEAMRLRNWFPETRAAATWHGTDADGGFWLGFHPPVASGGAVYVRFTARGTPDRCHRPTAGKRVVAFSAGRVVTVSQKDDGDVINSERTVPFPAR
jgi:hypothetical protein